MDAQKEVFGFELSTFFRLERTRNPSVSIAVYGDLLVSMVVQNSTTVDCGVRFLSNNSGLAAQSVTETLNEFRRMGLIGFIPTKRRGKKRLIQLIKEGVIAWQV